jgi:hypothetical protein
VRAAALISLLFALVLPGGAAASPSARYGIQDDAWLRYGNGTLEERLDQLVSLGVDLVRLNVLWSEIESPRGAFDWSGYDPVIHGLREHGIEPVLTLYSTPAWANGRRATNFAPTSGATFANFARRAAQRYPFVRRWLIWNEPNQPRWLRPTTPSVYVRRLLNPAYTAIHAVRANALVSGGVTAPRGGSGGVSPVAWITGMAAARARLDAYAHNPYPLRRTDTPWAGGCAHCATITLATLERLLGTVERSFGKGIRIWLTEYGYQTNPPDGGLGVSWGKQSLFTSEAALRARLAPRVDMLVHFLLKDEPNVSRWQSGFLTVRERVKPAYAAFRIPLAVQSRTGLRTTLWGQIRPGKGIQRYRLEQLRNRRWHAVGGTALTKRNGDLTRVVRAGPGARFRVIHIPTGFKSLVVIVR